MTPASLIKHYLTSSECSWSLGVSGAIAEFMFDEDETITIDESNKTITAYTPRGAIHVEDIDSLYCHAWEYPAHHGDSLVKTVGFINKSKSNSLTNHDCITALGIDTNAIQTEHQHSLFDLGVGSDLIQYCVRTDKPELIELLFSNEGKNIKDCAGALFPLLVEHAPHRVVFSDIGRIEVYTPIPPRSGKTDEGPHTHLLLYLLGKEEGSDPVANITLKLYPPNPEYTKYGTPRQFNQSYQDEFQDLLKQYSA